MALPRWMSGGPETGIWFGGHDFAHGPNGASPVSGQSSANAGYTVAIYLKAIHENPDLSLAYVLMYFLCGALPWQGLQAAIKKQKYDRIVEKKMTTRTDLICRRYILFLRIIFYLHSFFIHMFVIMSCAALSYMYIAHSLAKQ